MSRPSYAVSNVEVLDGFRLRVRFEDETEGIVDLSDLAARGGVFAAFRDPGRFRLARVDAQAGTVVWSNELDIAPEELYARAQKSIRLGGGPLRDSGSAATRRPTAVRPRPLRSASRRLPTSSGRGR